MKNPADLYEVCQELIRYIDQGDPVKDVLEDTPYSESELIYELALHYVRSMQVKEQLAPASTLPSHHHSGEI